MARARTPMLDMVMGLPDDLAAAASRAREIPLGKVGRFDGITVLGMGGSAIGGDLLRSLVGDLTPIPIATVRDYDLPATVTSKTLVLAVSYSGATEETLAAYEQAQRRRCRIVAVTSGGPLARRAGRAGHPVVPVQPGMPPRAALGHLFGSLLVVASRLGVVARADRQIGAAAALMVRRRESWRRRARGAAKALFGRMPVIYSTARLLDPVAERWRCQLNENAKVFCHVNVLPEQNHNEIVGLGQPREVAGKTVIAALVDRSTHRRTRRRLSHALAVTRGAWHRSMAFRSEGRTRLARMLSLVMLGDLVSVELARLRGVDPVPVTRIDELKRRMKREG